MWQNFGIHRILVQYFVHDRGVYLGLLHKDDKHLSIYRAVKSQDYFIIVFLNKAEKYFVYMGL